IVASTGSLRWSGRPWTPEAAWARQLDTALRDTPLDELTHELRGVFTILDLSTSGGGSIASDPLGFCFLYAGERGGLYAVSSRAALCAWGLADEGSCPARDRLGACWPAYSRHWIGQGTGYEGVRLLPPGATVTIPERQRPSVDAVRAPWMPTDDLHDLGRSDLLDVAYEELADAVRTTVGLPGDSHRADLTGGKDTRMI